MTLFESIREHISETTIFRVDSVWNESHEETQTCLSLFLPLTLDGNIKQVNLVFYKGDESIYKIEMIVDAITLLQASFSEREGRGAVYTKIKDKLVIFTTGGKIEVALT